MKALQKDTFREIRKTYKRFISILLMAMLGIAVFVGITQSGLNMRYSLLKYFNESNVFDIKIASTLGFTRDDLEHIKGLDGIKEAYGNYEKDVLLNVDDAEYVVSMKEYNNNVNKVEIVEGKSPEDEKECAVEEKVITEHNLKIGDIISITEDKDDDEDNSFKSTELKIVGVVKSPLYISREKDNSKLGDGKVDYYIYTSDKNINTDIFTTIYIVADVSKEYATNIEEYNKEINIIKDEIKNISSERKEIRYNSLRTNADKKIEDAQNELNSEKEKAQLKIADAEKKLNDSETKILNSEKELRNNIIKANNSFNNSEKELADQERVYNENKAKAVEGIEAAQKAIEQLNNQIVYLNNNIQTLNTSYENTIDEASKALLLEQILALEENKAKAQSGIGSSEQTIVNINNQIEDGKKQLENAKEKLKIAKIKTYEQLDSAQKKIADAKVEINNGKNELEANKLDFENKIEDAQNKLDDAKEKVSNLKYPQWYILNREQANNGYNSLMQEAENIDNISKVFPIIFFAVATLMSLSAMTRMVDEQRTEIGTLKAMGYSKIKIASKFILYAFLATIIGNIVGVVFGFTVISDIVISVCIQGYKLIRAPMYIDWITVLIGIIVTTVCIVGGAIYASYRKLKYSPAKLMIPKAPKVGKRVLLERVTFIWKRLTFSHKVTVRNIFRYKKRFLMAIFGICGATSLLLVGFGTKDSVSKTMPLQYEELYHYQAILGIKNSENNTSRDEVLKGLEDNYGIGDYLSVNMQAITLEKEDMTKDIQLIVMDNMAETSNFIELISVDKNEQYKLQNDSIVITQKLANIMKIKKGDNIRFRDEDGNEKNVIVGEIVKNYVSHYMYMSKELYKELYGDEANENVAFIKTNNLSASDEEKLSKTLLDNENISSVNFVSEINSNIKSLDFVIFVLIIVSALLAFLVLYNLSNINMTERIRELATLKVLGFYNYEVDKYVNREMTILTFIGAILGLGVGYILNYFVLEVGAPEYLVFPKIIEPISYVISIIIIMSFSGIVSIFSHFALKKISMIESLKSVE